MSTFATISIWIVGVIGSGVVNLAIMSYYVGKYRMLVEEIRDSAEESRKSLITVREDVARIKGRINGHGWRTEA